MFTQIAYPSHQAVMHAVLHALEKVNLPYTIDELNGYTGPEGEALFSISFTVGDTAAPHTHFLCFGQHGPELYAYVDTVLHLIEHHQAWARCYGRHTQINVLFAANPFGAAHMIRENEDLIDTNRCFGPVRARLEATLPDWYQSHDTDFNPESVSPWYRNKAISRLLLAEQRAGVVTRAYLEGQAHDPQRLHFVGATTEPWTNRLIRRQLETMSTRGGLVRITDFHSGITDDPRRSGALGVLTTLPVTSPRLTRERELFGPTVSSTHQANAPSQAANGTLETLVDRVFAEHPRVSTVCVEAGTTPAVRLFPRWRLATNVALYWALWRRRAALRLRCEAQFVVTRNEAQRAFFPLNVHWRRSVTRATRQLLLRSRFFFS